MKRFSYGERDYAFGQRMLTLRTAIGLTQAGLADLLGVSRRTVGEWEAGSSYPTTHNLKAFIALCVRLQSFPSGREEEEIRAFWKAAHQKVLLDESWLKTPNVRRLRPDVRPELIASVVSGAIFGPTGEWKHHELPLAADEMTRQMVLVITEGLAHLAPNFLPE